MPTFLVTGSTGRQGGSTARQLLSNGAEVHALVRNPSSEASKEIQSLGAVLFEGDSGNEGTISRALEGVTGIFFNPPYPGPEFIKECEIFINTCAARRETVKIFVMSSASGVEKHAERAREDPNYTYSQYFASKAAVETVAKDAGFQHLVILRPPWLMHNYIPPFGERLFPELKTERKLITALKPNTKVPHLKAEDVGKFAAAAMLSPDRFSGREINLAAENLTVAETAQIMSDVAGVEVKAPIAEFEGSKAVGVTSPVAGYQQWANEVDASIDAADLKEFGLELNTLRRFLSEQKESWKEALGV